MKKVDFLLVLTGIFLCLNSRGQMLTLLNDPAFLSRNETCYGNGWIDYDQDGIIDLYLTHTQTSPYLYRNDGSSLANLVSSGSAFPAGNSWSGISWGDFDNDNLNDLFITSMNGTCVLLKNLGNGEFSNVIREVGASDIGTYIQSTFIDYDNDGWLDLFLPTVTNLNFVSGPGTGNYLYQNNGDGTFTRALSSGLMDLTSNSTCASFADYDNDGDQDMFMTEFFRNNWFYENNGNGTFTQITGLNITDNSLLSLTCSWGDYDNDGFLDLFVGNGGTNAVHVPNYLFRNNGDKTFTRITEGAIASYTGCTWSAQWGDLDNDGDLDLYLGTIYEEDVIFLNNNDGTFTTYTDYDNRYWPTGVSLGDYDEDGFLDVALANSGSGGNQIYHNNGNSNHWILIKCTGTVSNRSAVGARVKIKAVLGGNPVWQIREINGNQGLRGFNDLRAHFGLADATVIDSLVVIWPSGAVTTMEDVTVNQVLNITEEIQPYFLQPLFTADTLIGRGTLTVQFTDKSIAHPDIPITTWSWDFDNDGTEDSNEQNPVYTFTNDTGQVFTVSLTISNDSISRTISRPGLVRIYPLMAHNLAFWGKATSSSVESESMGPQNAIDGNMISRWASRFSQPEWFQVEMDSVYAVGKVVIHWENAYGRSYLLSSSLNGTDWDSVYLVTAGNGGEDVLLFSPDTAKYYRLDCLSRATAYGFSIYEFEIYRTDGTIYLPVINNYGKEPEIRCIPNPFASSAVISFDLPFPADVVLEIYDMYGRKIETLMNSRLDPGNYRIPWETQPGTMNGMYICRMRLNSGSSCHEKRMVMVAAQ